MCSSSSPLISTTLFTFSYHSHFPPPLPSKTQNTPKPTIFILCHIYAFLRNFPFSQIFFHIDYLHFSQFSDKPLHHFQLMITVYPTFSLHTLAHKINIIYHHIAYLQNLVYCQAQHIIFQSLPSCKINRDSFLTQKTLAFSFQNVANDVRAIDVNMVSFTWVFSK